MLLIIHRERKQIVHSLTFLLTLPAELHKTKIVVTQHKFCSSATHTPSLDKVYDPPLASEDATHIAQEILKFSKASWAIV